MIDEAFPREVRWRTLVALGAGRPLGCSENLLQLALQDAQLQVTIKDVRRALDYLEKSELVKINRAQTWQAELTAAGIDVTEYNAPAPAGVGRPDKWW